MSEAARIRFTIGGWTVLSLKRRLRYVHHDLDQILNDDPPSWPELDRDDDGWRIYSLPVGRIDEVRARYPAWLIHDSYRYDRYYIDMAGGFDQYYAKFSSRTRSTLTRKLRKVAALSGGEIDVRAFRSPGEIAEFLDIAGALSARTYQERLMDAGLPRDQAARAHALDLAARDGVRAFLLFVGGAPISYLYLPVRNDILTYAYLGFDAGYAELSPGTVLQIEALRRLFAEERYRYFDFTEGEGAHKRLFGTGHVACATITVLKPGLSNWAALRGVELFDAAVGGAAGLAERIGAKAALRRLLKR
jgi:CelD/BcsL family acetyltransferase involved in cellulose biosynthesis